VKSRLITSTRSPYWLDGRRKEGCKEAASTARALPRTPRLSVIEARPPATMTHPPIASHAKTSRASCIGGSGSRRSMSPSRVSTSHDAVGVLMIVAGGSSEDCKAAVAQHARSAKRTPDTHARQIPPLPASLTLRPVFWRRRLQHLCRSMQIITVFAHADDAPVSHARSLTTRIKSPVNREERRLRSVHPRNQVMNLVHRRR
jgi:hypothetical protein